MIDSDYQSTNVSVVSVADKLLSTSLISSGTTPPGLTAALSGDVVLPLTKPLSGKVVLIDQSNDAIVWVDPATGKVLDDLSVATGFPSDPCDYREVSSTKAYVARYKTNPASGKQSLVEGGDVVVVDTSSYAITKSISLVEQGDGYQPHPGHLLLNGSTAWVTLDRFDVGYDAAGDARVVGIDTTTDTTTFTLTLTGFADCEGVAVSPSGNTVAFSCTGGDFTPPTLD